MTRDTVWFGYGADRVAGMAPHLEEKYTCDELIDFLLEKLARYEDTGMTPEEVQRMIDSMKAGRLIEQPVVVGDLVWEIRANYPKSKHSDLRYDHAIHTHQLRLQQNPNTCYVQSKKCTKSDMKFIGKTIFLTEEEALKTIEEAKRNARCSATE